MSMPTSLANAEPGPSNIASPALFLPPPGPPNPPSYLASTQDLLSRFNLLPAYDKYVRSAYAPASAQDHAPEPSLVDKGKAKQVAHSPAPLPEPDPDDEETEKNEKKKKNSYRHLIKAMPGKHSMRKDDYLMTMMQIPPKERMRIRQFDAQTQSEAFSVSLDGLKGWNTSALVLESAQAREDRKKRKELKKLAKMHAVQVAATTGSTPSAHAAQSAPTPHTQSHPTPTAAPTPQSSGTPRSSIPRPGSARPGASTPRPTPVLPPVTTTTSKSPRPGTPLRTATPTSAHPLRTSTPAVSGDPRGVKRERDEPSPAHVPNRTISNPSSHPPVQKPVAIVGAKANNAGIKPRPIKKQRMDLQGGARDVSIPLQQQPTPQGV